MIFQPAAPTRNVNSIDTRHRLLDAATDIFLQQGFRGARMQDIAAQATVRLSAINYHFGSKEGLYLAVLQHHADLALSQSPLPSTDAAIPAEERFRAVIRVIVGRFIDSRSTSRIAQLLVRELANPTAALDVMIERFTLPQVKHLQGLVREILGPSTTEAQIGRTIFSLFGQCVIYISGQAMIQRIAPELAGTPDSLDAIAHHIADFSLGGLRGLRESARHDTTKSCP